MSVVQRVTIRDVGTVSSHLRRVIGTFYRHGLAQDAPKSCPQNRVNQLCVDNYRGPDGSIHKYHVTNTVDCNPYSKEG